MLRIRLARGGRKGQASFRLVVADHARPVQGKYIQILGNFNPKSKEMAVEQEEILKWIAKGAKPSQTAARLLKKQGMAGMDKYIEHVHFIKKEVEKTPEAPMMAAPQPKAEKAEAKPEPEVVKEEVAETPVEEKAEIVEEVKEEAPAPEEAAPAEAEEPTADTPTES